MLDASHQPFAPSGDLMIACLLAWPVVSLIASPFLGRLLRGRA